MKTKSVFEFNSYKTVMAHYLTGEKKHGQLSRAAEFLNCQRSYLSRVITSKLQITPDHAFNLTKFWQFSLSEQEFFLNLVDYERAADPSYKAYLKHLLSVRKKKHESIEYRTQRSSFSVDPRQAYFSTWILSAVHFLTSIPEYQQVAALMDRLGLKEESILRSLEQLKHLGYVEQIRNRWVYKAGEFHTPKESPLVILHHQNWRSRAVIDAQNPESESIHYTGVHTLSKSDLLRLKNLLLNFIAVANQISTPSIPEDAVALTCDLFKV